MIASTMMAMAFSAAATATVVPTVYEAGHFYAVPETRDGQTLRLLVDTGGGGGGGMFWITEAAARRLHLHPRSCSLQDTTLTVADPPSYKAGLGLPPPIDGACGAAVMVQSESGTASGDGQLGAGYLPGRVWTFDYPAQRLMIESDDWRPDGATHSTPLGFQRNDAGERTAGFPRIVIRVDGQPLDMLLDTGATAHPTAAGKQASNTPVTAQGDGVTSYITTSILDRWHAAHPDWSVIANGDDLFGPTHATRIIRVPEVQIAGWSVGPVWFTERPDAAFHDFMSSMMDRRVEGAVGGNVFQAFVMTLDYPHETAYFSCVRGCGVATPPPAP